MESRENAPLIIDHHNGLFGSPAHWQNLITCEFGLPAEVLQAFARYPSHELRYKQLKSLLQHKSLPMQVRRFCSYPGNHEKLLACLANHEDLLPLLPPTEDAIWLHVALLADCPVVYQAIYRRNPERANRLTLALKMGNATAARWLRENLPDISEKYLVRELWDNTWDSYAARDLVGERMRLIVESDNLELFLAMKKELEYIEFKPLHLYYIAISAGSMKCVRWLKDFLTENDEEISDKLEVRRAVESKSEAMWQFVLGHSGLNSEDGKLDPRLQDLITSRQGLRSIVESGHLMLIRLASVQFTQDMTKGNWHSLLCNAVESGCIEVIELLTRKSKWSISKYTDLVRDAAYQGDEAMVRYLVRSHFPSYFADLDKEDAIKLMDWTGRSGNFELAQYVLDNIAAHTSNGKAIIKQCFELAYEDFVSQEYFDVPDETCFYMMKKFERLRYSEAETYWLNCKVQ